MTDKSLNSILKTKVDIGGIHIRFQRKKRGNSSGFYGENDSKGGHLWKQGALHLPRGERTGAQEKTHSELLARKCHPE